MTSNKLKKRLIFILIVIALVLLLSVKATPDDKIPFGLKRIQEKVFLKTKITAQAKVDYMSNLLEVRLEEMQAVLNKKSYIYVLPSSLRYSTLAGQITDLVVSNHLTDKIPALKTQFLEHQKILYTLYVIYPKNTSNLEYKYIEDDINYLKLYLDKLEKIK